jgi:hypothetical protein
MATKSLTESEAKALLYLVKRVYGTCAMLGEHLWHKPGRGNCSCPWARPAGGVIKRLRARGFVQRKRISGDPRTFYEATRSGEQHLRTDRATRVAAGLEKR